MGFLLKSLGPGVITGAADDEPRPSMIPPEGMTGTFTASATWGTSDIVRTKNDKNIGPATAIPEPESLALFASGLLSFPLGAKLIFNRGAG